MNATSLILAVFGHLVGDYLLQNDWMALNKKQRLFPCFVHCVLWTATVCAFAGWWSPLVIAVLFLTHFLQDHTSVVLNWMHLIGQSKFASAPCAPWSIIVVDNVWHLVTIFVVWRFLL